MDKSWINKPRSSGDYFERVQNFIKFAIEKGSMNGKIFCPCRKCVNNSSLDPQTIEEHLVWNGSARGYTKWVFPGEFILLSSCNQSSHIERRYDIRINNL